MAVREPNLDHCDICDGYHGPGQHPVTPELADPEPCSCDEALALRAELARLRTELARTRFLSVVRGRLCEAWAKMLDRNRAELNETQVAYLGCSLHRDELQAEVDRLHELRNAVGRLAKEVTEAKAAAETWEALCHEQEKLGEQADALVEKFQKLATEATAEMNAARASMDAAYTERNRLVAFLARVCKPTAGTRRTPIEGWNPEWTNCVFVDTTQGQMSWHYHDSDAHLFASLPAYEKPWDGHTTAEKYERLWRLTELTEAIP